MLETLLLPTIGLIIGLTLLVWSSDVFIDGAASTSLHFNVSPLIIGVVVLGFGTSIPEMIVSTLASIDGSPGLAIGNVIGSNIANIALVLGVAAIIAPITVKSSLLKREFPVLLGVTLIGYVLISNQYLGVIDGIILLTMFFAVMYWMIKINKNMEPNDPLAEETISEVAQIPKMSRNKALILVFVGLAILIGSAKLMVWGAVEIAQFFQVPDMIIGLTIIAIGTSLPELAAAISAARKNEADLMIGNILGSNLFNILAVLAMPALIAPSVIDSTTLFIDYPIMLALTVIMLLVAIPRKGKAVITKLEGFFLLGSFFAYLLLIYLRTVA